MEKCSKNDDLVNCDAIDHDPEAPLACESGVHQESLYLGMVMITDQWWIL